MDKEAIIQILSEHFKLVRTEFDYHQDEMATILGISKKRWFKLKKGVKSGLDTDSCLVCTFSKQHFLTKCTWR
jgi:DNA-binding XRE family transcriptional regulator